MLYKTKKPLDYELLYTEYPVTLEGYNDANYISDTKDLNMTSHSLE
jgi:hypothetical protein